MLFFFSSRRRHTRFDCDWSSDVCSSDLSLPTSQRCIQSAPPAPLLSLAAPTTGRRSPPASLAPRRSASVPAVATLQRPDRSEERRVGKEGSSSGWPLLLTFAQCVGC